MQFWLIILIVICSLVILALLAVFAFNVLCVVLDGNLSLYFKRRK